MNYQLHYKLLIDRAISENRKRYKKSDNRYTYYEKHHISPKCMNGSNNKENLVLLTPDEHYVAHQLLVKMYPENTGLLFAAIKMTLSGCGQRMNNKLYSWIRKRHIENNIRLHKEKKIGMHGKLHSDDTKKKMSENNYYKNGGLQLKGQDSPSYGLKRSAETRNKISLARAGVSNGIRTEETKEKMRESRKKQTKTSDKEISVNGITFKSATLAAKSIGIIVSAFCKRMRSGKYPDYFYL